MLPTGEVALDNTLSKTKKLIRTPTALNVDVLHLNVTSVNG